MESSFRLLHKDLSVFCGLGEDYYKTLDWEALVKETKAHAHYSKDYDHPPPASHWIKTRPAGDWCYGKVIPSVLAIDCEMCQTADPVTDEKEEDSLVRFVVVDGLNPSNIIKDSLVVPANPVTDMRTVVHGIQESELDGVRFTLRHAQAMLLDMCTEDTIIVGHSLHKDLKALRFVHTNVIDTAYLYRIRDESRSAPSIRDVSIQVLGVKLSDTHNPVEDARAALFAAAQLMVKNPVKEVERLSGKAKVVKHMLFFHHLPPAWKEENLKTFVVSNTKEEPSGVGPIYFSTPNPNKSSSSSSSSSSDEIEEKVVEGEGEAKVQPKVNFGKCRVEFSTKQALDKAFKMLRGSTRDDAQSRPTKKVYIDGKGGNLGGKGGEKGSEEHVFVCKQNS